MSARLAALALLALLLGACGGRSVVVEPARGGRDAGRVVRTVPGAGEYVVARGDTLYGIAFRHGLDYRDVARWNRIGPPYTIYPGQRIRLSPEGRRAATASTTRRPSPPAATPSRSEDRRAEPVRGEPQRRAVTAPPAATAAPEPAPARPPVASDPGPAAGPPGWRWPADGPLIGRFTSGDPTRQGIDIGGRAGDPVRAAADGEVVYSGAGLVGYGELIIVKHSETWLSAYAHNRKRLVTEGERVRAGQQIAELGRSGASRDMLHFEVRRNGKPIDPLAVLPKR